MANSHTGMAVTLVVAAAAALAGLALGVYGFHGKDRPLRLTTAALGLLGSAATGVLTLVFVLFYRW
jgi:ABC-type arginine transport system permease subunit